MQCPRCGALTADDALDTLYCSQCGAPLTESVAPTTIAAHGDASVLPTRHMSGQPEGEPTVAYAETQDATAFETPQPESTVYAQPVTPMLSTNGATVETGWAEFSGISSSSTAESNPNAYPQQLPVNSMASGAYPPQPVPGGYMSPNTYQQPGPGGYPYPYMPGFMPPIQPAPKRRGPLLAIVLSALVVLLVIGGVFAGIAIGQAHSKSATVQTSPTATPTPDAQHLYQQVTKQTPFVTDSLQETTSGWVVGKTTDGECKIQSDGLHILVHQTAYFHYCTSGQGEFSNFAFQVNMKILSGEAGGIVFRDDTNNGNYYAFFAYLNGSYRVYAAKNHHLDPEMRAGMMDSFNVGQENTLTLIAQGDQIYLYVNQEIFAQIQDSTYSSGYVGVLADDHDAPAEVVYTNAKFWTL